MVFTDSLFLQDEFNYLILFLIGSMFAMQDCYDDVYVTEPNTMFLYIGCVRPVHGISTSETKRILARLP